MNNFNLEVMHRIVRLSALMHDLGKSTKGFQQKLSSVINKDKASLLSGDKTSIGLADPLRHELVSVLLLLPLLEEGKLSSLSTPEKVKSYFSSAALSDFYSLKEKIKSAISQVSEDEIYDLVNNFDNKIPLLKSGKRILCKGNWEHCAITSSIVWLILCHHRINAAHISIPETPKTRKRERKRKKETKIDNELFSEIKINSNYINPHGFQNIDLFFEFSNTPLWHSDSWCLCVSDIVNELIQLQAFNSSKFKLDLFNSHALFYKAKTALIYGDHLGSAHSEICEYQDSSMITYGNTRQDEDGLYRWADSLLKHTIKVTHKSSEIFERLFLLEHDEYRKLPAIHSKSIPDSLKPIGLKSDSPYYWQEHVVNQLSTIDKNRGFFGIVVSGTGAGKTKGCPMIMSNICNETRFTLALGRKTLTQQAFRDYTSDIIGFSKSDVSMLIGSHVAPKDHDIDVTGNGVMDMNNTEHADFSGDVGAFNSPLMELFSEKSKEHSMLSSPISVMTVDHIISLVTQRRSSHCKLMLIAMNNDLIIDELDDFDASSLVAIGKLIYLFASFGRKVIISSATISPVIAQSMLNAYLHGYEIHKETINDDKSPYTGFISNKSPYLSIQDNSDIDSLMSGYGDFIDSVCQHLYDEPKRRFAKYINLVTNNNPYDEDEAFSVIDDQVSELHKYHNIKDKDGFKLSFGFVRFNHVKSAQQYAIHLLNSNSSIDIDYKVVCYHSRMLNVDRFAVEEFLDTALKRTKSEPFENELISKLVDESKINGKKELMIVVSTTSIQETGRDHDYDWIITEPLSDRSIIQCAGRVLRHRPNVRPNHPNIVIFSDTIKSYMGKPSAWGYPGIETDHAVNAIGERLNRPRYPVSFNFENKLSQRLELLMITQDCSEQKANAINSLSNKFTANKIDASPAIRKVSTTSESLVGALETIRNYDYLLSSGSDNPFSLGTYITCPSIALSTTHGDHNQLRDKNESGGTVSIEVKLKQYKQGTDSNNWQKYRVAKRGFEVWNINIKNYYNSDLNWDRVLLDYSLADKVDDISLTHYSNKGSVTRYLSSARISVGSNQAEVYYSPVLGFLD
ncbi:hypothetical protein RGL65_005247 [Vibrio parahaemolyticus]|nr:hypothetical protein [Vibrio parahaemolyticus]ELA8201106.1 hypothetical protein [Vibrio parahaemolyticus]